MLLSNFISPRRLFYPPEVNHQRTSKFNRFGVRMFSTKKKIIDQIPKIEFCQNFAQKKLSEREVLPIKDTMLISLSNIVVGVFLVILVYKIVHVVKDEKEK